MGGQDPTTISTVSLSIVSAERHLVSNLRVSSSWISTARFVYVRERRGLLLLLLLPCRLLSSGRDVASAHTDARCQKRDVRWTLPWIQHEESRLLTSPPPTAPHRTAPPTPRPSPGLRIVDARQLRFLLFPPLPGICEGRQVFGPVASPAAL